MRKHALSIMVLIVMLASIAIHEQGVAQGKMEKSGAMMQQKSLYQRLGSYDAIAGVVDDFIGRLIADPQITRFFTGASTDTKNRIRQFIVDQLCAATGGPCVYVGRSMKTVHAGLGITEADWQSTVKHLVATLDRFNVPQKEKDEVLAAISSMKGDIVEKM